MATSTTVRQPAVAGRFYPRNPEQLRREAERYLAQAPIAEQKPVRAIGCIAPHAGYMFSGHVAGAVFASLEVPKRCIVLCPNHTGMGRPLAIMSEGGWETPLGAISIDTGLAASLKERCPALQEDSDAHRAEHSAEVELPFLQLRQPDLRFVPIALGTAQFEPLEELGKGLADVIAAQADPILIVASSDMNHYESDVVTRIKDQRAIERILTLDPRGLHEVVTQQGISMCGFGPAVAMLTAARQLGAKSAELIKYATSGDVSGDRNMVVGYAGIIVA
ncbi:MAG TPA: AmmeMemoRadiSam system protein B [Candidatus Sulfotelmatobacter sp.]|nr:AmmeMemoRadiSam system protein B [Candidatus Sulfotelmatobacter sp.]